MRTKKELLEGLEKFKIGYEKATLVIEDILMKSRGYITRSPRSEDVVAICSGGLDSSVMVHRIISEWDSRVHMLYFKRNASAEIHEEKAFDFFVDFYKKKFPKNILSAEKIPIEIPPVDLKNKFNPNLCKTVGHPLRNSTMLNFTVMYAVSLEKKFEIIPKTIFTGSVGELEYTPEQGILSLRSQTLNTCANMGDWEWQVTSPLSDPEFLGRPLYKTNLITYAKNNFIPLEKTRTCFSKDEIADGTCEACKTRLNAFNYLKIGDPVKYQNRT